MGVWLQGPQLYRSRSTGALQAVFTDIENQLITLPNIQDTLLFANKCSQPLHISDVCKQGRLLSWKVELPW